MYYQELTVATEAAREAGLIALRYWTKGVTPDWKSDLSPVTIADREAERAIAARLSAAFPEDGLLGEEGASRPSRSGRRWIIDPIDGTRDFLRGHRTWGILIGLEHDGDVVAGVAFFPALDERFSAARGAGAFCNDAPIRVSSVSEPSQAMVCINGLNHFISSQFGGQFLDSVKNFGAVRSFGGCMDAMMVARGQADLWIEPVASPWDLAPLKIIIEEAGGRFVSFAGEATIHGGNCVAYTPSFESLAHTFVRVD